MKSVEITTSIKEKVALILSKAPSYTSLHNHTDYSNLRLRDSINTPKDLIIGGYEKGLNGIAITDHEVLSGHFDMLNLQKKYANERKGKKGEIKPPRISKDYGVILGNEIYLVDDVEAVKEEGRFPHFLLLSKNKQGHLALRQLTNQAWENMFSRGGMERVPISKEQFAKIMIEQGGKGNIIGSSACLGGEVAQATLDIIMYETLKEYAEEGFKEFKNDLDKELMLSRFIPNMPNLVKDKWAIIKALQNSNRSHEEELEWLELKGKIIRHFFAELGSVKKDIVDIKIQENKRKLHNFITWCIEVFGKEDFYLEIQPSLGSEQILFNNKIVGIAEAYGLEIIATTDSHYLNREEIVLQEAFLTASEGDREVMSFYESCFVHTPEELATALLQGGLEVNAIVRAMQNTNIIKAQCTNHLNLDEEVHIPTIDDIDMSAIDLTKIKEVGSEYENIMKFANSEYETDRYMLYVIQEGMRIKKQEWNRTNLERIDIELYEMWEVGNHVKQHMSDYHITVRELINIMWEGGDSLVGISRGSASGFYTLYLMDIVQMNPIEQDLPHWRYMHHSKPSLAD